MRLGFFAALMLVLASCLDFSLGGKGSADAGPHPDGAAPKTDAGTPEGGSGINCGADPQTGNVLCLGLSSCPGLIVDQNNYPGCGFRVTGGTTIDIECACSGYLCPLGVATSCTQAKSLLASQTYAGVCVQVSEGRCTTAK